MGHSSDLTYNTVDTQTKLRQAVRRITYPQRESTYTAWPARPRTPSDGFSSSRLGINLFVIIPVVGVE